MENWRQDGDKVLFKGVFTPLEYPSQFANPRWHTFQSSEVRIDAKVSSIFPTLLF